MKKIYKYELEVTDKQVVMVPEDSEPLSVQVQNGIVCLWMLVDPDQQLEELHVFVVGTGNKMPAGVDEHDYVGTVQVGEFVWHVFAP